MQVDARAARDLDQGEAGAGLEPDAVPRMEGDRLAAGLADGKQDERAAVDTGSDMQPHAVLGQHGVQRHHRHRRVRQAAEIGMGGEGGQADMVRRGRQRRLVAAIDEHEPGGVQRRREVGRVRDCGQPLLEAAIGDRPQRGVFPSFVAPVRQAGGGECLGRSIPQRDVAGQAVAQPAIARDEGVRAVPDFGVHAASATTWV